MLSNTAKKDKPWRRSHVHASCKISKWSGHVYASCYPRINRKITGGDFRKAVIKLTRAFSFGEEIEGRKFEKSSTFVVHLCN